MIKRLLLPFLVFFLITIVVVNIYLWRNYLLIQKELEGALANRLISIATAIAADIDNLKELDEKRPYFDQLIRSMGIYNIYILDSEGKIRYRHKQLKFLKGPDPHLALDRPAILSALSGEASATPLYKETEVYLKSGYAPIFDLYGGVIGVVGVVADAPFFSLLVDFERKGLLLNLILILALITISIGFAIVLRRISRIEENIVLTNTFAVLGQLASTVAHEIKNPLSIITAALDRLRRRPDDQKAIEFIKEETKRIDQIVRGYLSLGRRDFKGEVDINRIAEEVVETLRPRLSDKRVGIELKLDPKMGKIMANPGAMRQVLINLLTNSYEAIEEEGKILIQTGFEKGKKLITVADTGMGIDQKEFKRIFSPFYTTKSKGSGLGLFVVKRTIESLGGRISLDRIDGYNTTIRIELPDEDTDR